jgi:hypothetical protein
MLYGSSSRNNTHCLSNIWRPDPIPYLFLFNFCVDFLISIDRIPWVLSSGIRAFIRGRFSYLWFGALPFLFFFSFLCGSSYCCLCAAAGVVDMWMVPYQEGQRSIVEELWAWCGWCGTLCVCVSHIEALIWRRRCFFGYRFYIVQECFLCPYSNIGLFLYSCFWIVFSWFGVSIWTIWL